MSNYFTPSEPDPQEMDLDWTEDSLEKLASALEAELDDITESKVFIEDEDGTIREARKGRR